MQKLTGCIAVAFLLSSAAPSWAAAPADGGLSKIQHLGKIMYQDKDFSYNSTMSCQTCHHRTAGFADPENSRDPYNSVASTGADGVSTGGRNAPSAAYAGYSPPLYWDSGLGSYVGGMFWDGRASGHSPDLADPLAEQAQGPPLNPVEMNMPDAEAVVQAVRDSNYVHLFQKVFGPDSLDDATEAYNNIARAIAAYERSSEIQAFASRFDANELSVGELRGLALVEKHCSTCHATTAGNGSPSPLFTNYSYADIGVPYNPLIGNTEPDTGLGGYLEEPDQNGKFKVPTLRNTAVSAPYGHNGYFPTLRMMVDFHNTRDTGDWAPPEVTDNLNTTDVGAMGLTEDEVDDIVAFLYSLTDTRK